MRAADRPRLRLRRARHGRADARAPGERRAAGADRRHRHGRARDRAAPRRRVPPRARRVGSRLRRRDARGLPAPRASTPSCRSRRSTSSGSPRRRSASRASPCSSRRRRRSAARTTRPRPTRCSTGSACAGRPGGACRAARPSAAAARELGYPDVDVCMKPVFSSGSRGFRVLSASADRHEQLLSNRPGRRGGASPGGSARPARRRPDRAARDGARDRRRSGRSTGSRSRAGSRSATRRRARRCAPGSRCTSRRSTTRR